MKDETFCYEKKVARVYAKKFNIKTTYDSSNTNSSNYSMYKYVGSGKWEEPTHTHTETHSKPSFLAPFPQTLP